MTDDDTTPAFYVDCPDCGTNHIRPIAASHIFCPECKTTFHQNWKDQHTLEGQRGYKSGGVIQSLLRRLTP